MNPFRNTTSVHCLWALLACLLLMPMASASARDGDPDHRCHAQYTEAQGTLLGEILEPHASKVRTHVSQAWGMFWQGQPLATVNRRIDSALLILSHPGTLGATPESKAIATEAIQEFRDCVNGAPPANTALLEVSTYRLDETAPGLRGPPAGDGVRLYVDDLPVAITDADGRASFEVPAGRFELMAVIPSMAVATAAVEVAAGESRDIALVLDDSKEVVFPATAVVDAMQDGLLPHDFATFGIQLFNGGSHRALQYVSEVAIEDDIGNTLLPLGDAFMVDALGNLQSTDVAALRAALADYRGRELVLKAEGEDALGFTLSARTTFFIASHGLEVQLVAPPSHPALALGQVQVDYALMGTSLRLARSSDANGFAGFGQVPFGNTALTAHVSQGGREYYGEAVYFAGQASRVVMVMRHAEDVEAGVPPYQLQPYTGPQVMQDAIVPALPQRTGALAGEAALPAAFVAQNASTRTLRVSANQANANVTGSVTLTAPQGSTRVYLRYRVSTAEYPVYVQQQSVYNDTWSLSVLARASGQQFHAISRNVNSQLANAPVWRADGTTGDIEHSFDVSALAAAAPADIVLSASAMNVGDGRLPTIVDAEISVDADRLVVSGVRAEQLANAKNHVTFSQPLDGESNTLHRWFLMDVDVPEGATITRVRAEILDSSDNVLATLYDEAPGANVQRPSPGMVRARVTRALPSDLGTAPPPAHNITYRFTVFALDAEGQEISGEGSSRIMRALWRMQEAWRQPARRYGMRDNGHDDWLSARTWEYIGQHGHLLTRIDDISGEHGRNIGHSTHDAGTDIDLFHTHTFPGAYSGNNNYELLRNAVVRALAAPADQAVQERAGIAAWVASTRQTLAAVLTTTDAQHVYYMIGNAHAGQGIQLPRGWAQRLLVHGTLAASGATLDTGLGAWGFDQSRLTYNAVHNSHWHIKRPRDR